MNNLFLALNLTALCLLLASCKPRTQVEIPDPIGNKNKMICSDGEKYIFCEFVGGPSESVIVDYSQNPFEIEINNVANSRYLSAATTIAKGPISGQLVAYEGSNQQTVTALATSIPLVKLDNGIAKPVNSIELKYSQYFPTTVFHQTTVWPSANWSLPATNYATLASSNFNEIRLGYLTFADSAETSAYLFVKFDNDFDSAMPVKLELFGWTGGAGKQNALLSIDYSCMGTNKSVDVSWTALGQINVYLSEQNVIGTGFFESKLSCKSDEFVRFKITRLGSNENDNLQSAFRLDSAVLTTGRKLTISPEIIQ